MSEIKKPFELKEGEFCYIKDQVCQVHKIRTACGEYYMAGVPVIGEKKELDHIVDCTETVKVPIAKRYKVAKINPSSVVVSTDSGEREIRLEDGPVADNLRTLEEAGTKQISVKVIEIEGRGELIVDVEE